MSKTEDGALVTLKALSRLVSGVATWMAAPFLVSVLLAFLSDEPSLFSQLFAAAVTGAEFMLIAALVLLHRLAALREQVLEEYRNA